MRGSPRERVSVGNVNHPGQVRSADADMYRAMKGAFLKVLPKRSPGLTAAEIRSHLAGHLPEDLFPGGAKAGWWQKTVQFDLEAKGTNARESTRPMRLRKT